MEVTCQIKDCKKSNFQSDLSELKVEKQSEDSSETIQSPHSELNNLEKCEISNFKEEPDDINQDVKSDLSICFSFNEQQSLSLNQNKNEVSVAQNGCDQSGNTKAVTTPINGSLNQEIKQFSGLYSTRVNNNEIITKLDNVPCSESLDSDPIKHKSCSESQTTIEESRDNKIKDNFKCSSEPEVTKSEPLTCLSRKIRTRSVEVPIILPIRMPKRALSADNDHKDVKIRKLDFKKVKMKDEHKDDKKRRHSSKSEKRRSHSSRRRNVGTQTRFQDLPYGAQLMTSGNYSYSPHDVSIGSVFQ